MCRQSCGRCLVEKPELPDKDLHGDYCTNIEKYINDVSTTTTTPATTTTTTGRLTVRSMQSFEFHVGEYNKYWSNSHVSIIFFPCK